jgi:NAD-dependent deacetylase
MAEASAAVQRCDLCIVVGSSLVVYPAAELPLQAVRSGARLAIVNASDTALDPYADLVIPGQAGVILPALVDAVRGVVRGTGPAPDS